MSESERILKELNIFGTPGISFASQIYNGTQEPVARELKLTDGEYIMIPLFGNDESEQMPAINERKIRLNKYFLQEAFYLLINNYPIESLPGDEFIVPNEALELLSREKIEFEVLL